jgi:hypothetical protein
MGVERSQRVAVGSELTSSCAAVVSRRHPTRSEIPLKLLCNPGDAAADELSRQRRDSTCARRRVYPQVRKSVRTCRRRPHARCRRGQLGLQGAVTTMLSNTADACAVHTPTPPAACEVSVIVTTCVPSKNRVSVLPMASTRR